MGREVSDRRGRVAARLDPRDSGSFAFPPDVLRVIYTTNALESVHAQLRKIIKTRGHFPNDEAATKLIWLALRNITAKWARGAMHWKTALRQFASSTKIAFSARRRKMRRRMDAAGPPDAQYAPTGPWKTAQNAVSHSAHTQHRLTRSTPESPDTPVLGGAGKVLCAL